MHTRAALPTNWFSYIGLFILNQYLMAKVETWIIIGYLPSSAIAAKLVDLEWTPRIRLQNFICNFSVSEIILKNFFLNISIFVKLPSKWIPHTSEQYNSIGETRAEKSFKSTLTGTLSKFEKFLNILWYAPKCLTIPHPLSYFKTTRIMESDS